MAGYIGPIPVPQATQSRETFTATASQTSFGTAGYQVGYLDVFMNGVKLAPADFTATNGSDVVLASGAAVNDIIEVVSYSAFEVLNQNFTGTTVVDNLTVGGNLTVDGTTTTINSTTLNVDDINITVASGAADSAAANGAGLTVDGAGATFNYSHSGTKWTMNKPLDVGGNLDVTGTLSSDGLTVQSASEAAGLFYGYSSITGVTSVSNGEIRIGQNSNFQGRISYDGQGDGVLYVENSYNNAAADIMFRSKVAGTAQNKLLIDATGDVSLYDSTGANAKFFWDASAESLGIGTAAPITNLDIRGSADAIIRLKAATGTADQNTFELRTIGATGYEGFAIRSVNDANSVYNTRLQIDSSGKVIIGNTTASGGIAAGGLDVADRIAVGSGSVGTPSLHNRDDTNTGIFFGTDILAVATGGVERLRVDASGNVDFKTGGMNLKLPYNSTTSNSANLSWGMLQLGNNGANRIIAGNTQTGGDFEFIVNNTADLSSSNSSSHNGTVAMAIDSSGNVGVGVADPLATLHVKNLTTDYAGDLMVSSTRPYLVLDDVTVGQNGFSIGVDGNVMTIGTGDFSANSNVYGTERLRIDASGNLLVGKTASSITTAGCRLGANGGSEIVAQGNNNTALKIASTDDAYIGLVEFFTSGGTQCGYILGNGSAVSLVSLSDYRLKENIVDLTSATERLKQLSVHRFNFINNPDETIDGFLAHEVQAVVPEAAHGTQDAMMDEEYEVTPAVYEDVVIEAVLDDEGNELESERTEQNLVTAAVMGTRSVPDYQGIDQSKLVPLLTAALQEALTKIDDMETRLAALEG